MNLRPDPLKWRNGPRFTAALYLRLRVLSAGLSGQVSDCLDSQSMTMSPSSHDRLYVCVPSSSYGEEEMETGSTRTS